MPTICSVCDHPCMNDGSDVKCSGKCKRPFHLECIKDEVEGIKTRSTKEWICKECRKSPSTQSSVSSSAATNVLTKEFLVKVVEDLKKSLCVEMETFKKDITKEITDLTISVDYLSKTVDETSETMKKIQADLTATKKEVVELRSLNKNLKTDVGELKDRIRFLEQYTRKNNVEISGIPETPRESVIDIVKDIGAALGVEVQDNQVTAAHRVPSYKKDRIPALVVQFQNRSLRDAWIDGFKKKKTITAKDVNVAYPPNKVYVNEHLSPANKIILSELKAKSKDIGYKYVWCRDGKFFVRKSDGESCKRINSYEDFDKLK